MQAILLEGGKKPWTIKKPRIYIQGSVAGSRIELPTLGL